MKQKFKCVLIIVLTTCSLIVSDSEAKFFKNEGSIVYYSFADVSVSNFWRTSLGKFCFLTSRTSIGAVGLGTTIYELYGADYKAHSWLPIHFVWIPIYRVDTRGRLNPCLYFQASYSGWSTINGNFFYTGVGIKREALHTTWDKTMMGGWGLEAGIFNHDKDFGSIRGNKDMGIYVGLTLGLHSIRRNPVYEKKVDDAEEK